MSLRKGNLGKSAVHPRKSPHSPHFSPTLPHVSSSSWSELLLNILPAITVVLMFSSMLHLGPLDIKSTTGSWKSLQLDRKAKTKLNKLVMLSVITATAAVLLAASPALGAATPSNGDASHPVINLGTAGSYLGVIQNNGTYVGTLKHSNTKYCS
jgi:hypothetical protein